MKLKISILVAVAGLACFIAFKLIGSTIDAEGFLQEPFGLIPIGYALCFIGGIGTLIFGAQAWLSLKGT